MRRLEVLILLHSTTGNTGLIARFCQSRLRRAGHSCSIHDVAADPAPPALEGVDLLGVACPTMYLRPSAVMEQAVAQLPPRESPGAAFLLATAGGLPGAHFDILERALGRRGWTSLDAHWVPFINNWPPHRVLTRLLRAFAPVGAAVDRRLRGIRWYLHWLWPDLGEPEASDRDALITFIDGVVDRAAAGDLSPAPRKRAGVITRALTRQIGVEQMRWSTAVRIDPARCSSCGTCVAVCPVGSITWASGVIPRVGATCTGCWACYHHCPDRAIAGFASPGGQGRYPGPSPAVKALFRSE